jgi:hypothetical protein
VTAASAAGRAVDPVGSPPNAFGTKKRAELNATINTALRSINEPLERFKAKCSDPAAKIAAK